MNTVVWRLLKSALPLGLFAALLAAVVLSGWIVSAGAPGWVRMAGIEIQAACRDAGTQWMVVVCLASYCVTFLFLQRRLFQPQKNTKNANGETVPPPSDFRPPSSITAFLAFFRGNVSNPDFWLVGFVGLVLLRYAFAYETAARSLQPLVLLTGIVLGKGIVLWGAWKPGLKAEGPGLKLEGDDSSGCGTFAPSAAEKGDEAQGVSAPSSIHHQLSTFNRSQVILSILVFLLAVSALWQPEYGMEFQYRGLRRWTGALDNPNIYGMLMGVGVTLAVGLLFRVASFKLQVSSPGTERLGDAASVGGASVLASRLASSLASPEVSGVHGVTRPTSQRSCVWCVSWLRTRRFLIFTFLISAFVLCGFGLLKSYSRGAWLGTGVAMAWLVRSWVWRIGDAE